MEFDVSEHCIEHYDTKSGFQVCDKVRSCKGVLAFVFMPAKTSANERKHVAVMWIADTESGKGDKDNRKAESAAAGGKWR